jgi:hypothetical protein
LRIPAHVHDGLGVFELVEHRVHLIARQPFQIYITDIVVDRPENFPRLSTTAATSIRRMG